METGAERIGVAGLGRMGTAMARRLAAQGRSVTGWTRSGAAAGPGVGTAASLEELAAASDVILLSLFDDAAVREVVERLSTCQLSGRLVVDTSTVAPTLLPGLAPGLEAAGARAVDAPISGGPEMVEAGTCGVFLGGAEEDCARAAAVARDFSGRVLRIGPLGAGMGMKVVNNMALAGYFAALCETVQVARRAGIPFDTAVEVLARGPAGAPVFEDRLPRVRGEDESVGFPISGTRKDAGVFLRAADTFGVAHPCLSRAAELMDAAAGEGLAGEDVARLIRFAWDTAGDALDDGAREA